jgi:hypothetical protein
VVGVKIRRSMVSAARWLITLIAVVYPGSTFRLDRRRYVLVCIYRKLHQICLKFNFSSTVGLLPIRVDKDLVNENGQIRGSGTWTDVSVGTSDSGIQEGGENIFYSS